MYINFWGRGGGGVQVVSLFDLSSTQLKSTAFFCKNCWERTKINKRGPEMGPIVKKGNFSCFLNRTNLTYQKTKFGARDGPEPVRKTCRAACPSRPRWPRSTCRTLSTIRRSKSRHRSGTKSCRVLSCLFIFLTSLPKRSDLQLR